MSSLLGVKQRGIISCFLWDALTVCGLLVSYRNATGERWKAEDGKEGAAQSK